MLGIVRVLLLLQGGFALLSTFEVVMTGVATGFLPALAPAVALTAATGLLFLVLAAWISRRSRIARRIAVAAEVTVVAVALVDLGLALFLAHAPLDLVPLLTRFVLPVGVIVLLRGPRRPMAEAQAPLGAHS